MTDITPPAEPAPVSQNAGAFPDAPGTQSDLVWTDSPTVPHTATRALGEARLRQDHQNWNPGDRYH